jgi:hypothetical protein
MEKVMTRIWVGLLAVAALGAASGGALADTPPSAGVTATGSVAPGCSLGVWSKDSGGGQFTAGKDAVVTYADGDLVDASGNSIVSPSTAVKVRVPMVCNTAVSWTVTSDVGALRLTSGATPPTGFSNQWLYTLMTAPYTSGGVVVGSLDTTQSDGSPIFEGNSLSATRSLTVSYFGMTFSPNSQSEKMLAGNYAEKITLTVSPSF